MNTSSLQSQIIIHSRPLRDAMKAASKIQLELIEAYTKQNSALNTAMLSALEHGQLATLQSAIQSAINQVSATFKDQAILNSSLYVTNDAISSETISEIEEISDYVEETIIALTNDNSITRREYFERFNDYWVGLISIINNKKTMAVTAVLSFLVATVLQPVGIALTSKYIIDEFIEKNPESVQEAKNVLKDIPMNKELKTNYRMVIKDTLVVRKRPKTKSNVAYVLDKSSIVFVEEKKKNWSKVLFRNEAGEDQSGWVYTRYIKKLD
ncbi:SH3 domain-containing protein [Bacillus siamensis]|uniref:SH3 domain-containing protein n=2 Tax=Bacillaceae TaxID=186817 RepID=UPI00068ECF14|nr:SH3 domain-containing protein [Bacillus siamensis]